MDLGAVWDQARKLPVGKGVRLTYPSPVAAKAARFLLYKHRAAVRRMAREALPSTDVMWGKSPWEFPLEICRPEPHILWVGRVAPENNEPLEIEVGEL